MPLQIPQLNQDLMVFDNSGLDCFKLCRRKYLYRHIFHLRPKAERKALTFGSAIHKGLEFYYLGHTPKECIAAFVKEATRIGSQLQLEKTKEEQEYTIQFGAELLLDYFRTYPIETDSFSLLKDDDGKPYAEVGFALAVDSGIVVGKVDGIGIYKSTNRPIILEHKTTSKSLNQTYFATYNPNNQVAMYMAAVREYLGECPQFTIINALRVKDFKKLPKEEEDKRKFSRILTARNAGQLDQRLRQIDNEIKEVKRAVEGGFDAFYQNAPQACYYRDPCEYIPLCKAQTEELVELVAHGGGYVEEKWEPYAIFEGVEKKIEVEAHVV